MPVPKNMSTLEKIAITWGDIEAPVLAGAACGIDFGIRGVHGNGKTTVATIIARALGLDDKDDDGVRVIYADKASIITLAGIPDMESSRKNGETTFLKNKRALIGDKVQVIFIDELTRATKENQNHLLEVIESKTLMGHKLNHKLCITSFNPDTYKGAVKLDAALLDRFAFILPASDFSDLDTDQIEKMIDINMRRIVDDTQVQAEVVKELREKFVKIRACYDSYLKDTNVIDRVKGYCVQFLHMAIPKVKASDSKILLSGREIGRHMFRSLLAIAAYYQGVLGRDLNAALEEASSEVLSYCFVTKHAMEGKLVQALNAIHADAKYMLRASGKGEAGKVQLAFARAISTPAKVIFWKDRANDVIKHLDEKDGYDMMEFTLNKIVEEENNLSNEKDVKKQNDARHSLLKVKTELFAITSAHKEFEAITDRVEGALLCDIIHTLQTASVDVQKEPYKTMFSKVDVNTNDLLDILVHINKASVKAGN